MQGDAIGVRGGRLRRIRGTNEAQRVEDDSGGADGGDWGLVSAAMGEDSGGR